jgi:hypothetical protein
MPTVIVGSFFGRSRSRGGVDAETICPVTFAVRKYACYISCLAGGLDGTIGIRYRMCSCWGAFESWLVVEDQENEDIRC